jgi:endonuclease YncB( thermonuclease family)
MRYVLGGLLIALVAWSLLLLAATMGHAEDLHHVEYVKAYDGDTITVNVPGLPMVFGQHLRVRFADVDTPEIKGQCDREKTLAVLARDYVDQRLRKAKAIVLHNVKADRYFRIDATVLVDGKNLNQELLEAGLARPYDGGKRESWCP